MLKEQKKKSHTVMRHILSGVRIFLELKQKENYS